MMPLKVTKAKILRALKAEKANISKSQFDKKLHFGKEGYAVPKGRRVDTCPCCYSWGCNLAPTLERADLDSMSELLKLCPALLVKWAPPELGKPRAESPLYMKSYLGAIDVCLAFEI